MEEELRFLSFSSGSNGNAYYLGTKTQGLLIDAGVSEKQIKKGLDANGISYDAVLAVLITHDHYDHIRSLVSYCKKIKKPVYTSEYLSNCIFNRYYQNPLLGTYRHSLNTKDTQIGDFIINYFEVPHDASQTLGFAIRYNNQNFVLMTDLGYIPDEALSYAKNANSLVIESNYDVDMLLSGSYTHELKMRIVNNNGHLSNDSCAEAVKNIYHKNLKNIFLCHLSHNNNTAKLAYSCTFNALSSLGLKDGDVNLQVLPRVTCSDFFKL